MQKEILTQENIAIKNQENCFEVAISHNNALGFIEYNALTKKATITIADEKAKKAVENFLQKDLKIGLPQDSLSDFKETIIKPLQDIRNLQIALTRLWEETDVHVDWSRPVDYVRLHPSY